MRPVSVSASATFDENGRAVAQLGPSTFGIRWTIKRMSTSTTSGAESQLVVYRNAEQASARIDGTYTANQNTSETEIALQTLEKLVFVWTQGDPGSVATIVLEGTQEGR